jgi:UDPglucose--hexose-1-phosphate uridylyltransferase
VSEIRQDRTTGVRVLIAPERRGRPFDRISAPARERPRRPGDAVCPFCPGNEKELSEILDSLATDEPPHWRVRAVSNKYPAVRPETPPLSAGDSFHTAVAGRGRHEVIIETPQHDVDIDGYPDAQLEALSRFYVRRFKSFLEAPETASAILFRNRGADAGASIAHAHSQLIGLPVLPTRLERTAEWGRAYHARHGQCVVCDEIRFEIENGSRIVHDAEDFLSFVPFAAEGPFEIRIAPKRHQALFSDMESEETAAFGRALRAAVARIKTVLGNAPYNFVVQSGGRADRGSAFRHWVLRILPVLLTPGGFELGSGMAVNTSAPEADAQVLRAAGPPGAGDA